MFCFLRVKIDKAQNEIKGNISENWTQKWTTKSFKYGLVFVIWINLMDHLENFIMQQTYFQYILAMQCSKFLGGKKQGLKNGFYFI